MQKKNDKIIHLVYGIVVSCLVVALGAALIWSVIDIYQADPTGDPYSPATIGDHFDQIAILVYATLTAILGGILMNLFTKKQKEKVKPIRDNRALMLKAAAKAGNPTPAEQAAMNKAKRNRLLITVGCLIIFSGLMVYPAIHVLFRHDYHASPNGEVLRSAVIILGPMVLGFTVCHIGSLLVSKSYELQTGIYKQIINDGRSFITIRRPPTKIAVNLIRSAILVAAIAMIIAGIFNGTARDVLTKAVAICTECIGLG